MLGVSGTCGRASGRRVGRPTRDDVRAVMAALAPPYQFVAPLLYGAGLRLLAARRLRVKDLDLELRELVMRGGKGDYANRIRMVMSVAVSQHLARIAVGKPHRGPVLSRLEHCSALRPSGQCQRTRSRARGGNREDGTHHQ